jgi:hypothetical protein
MRFDDVRLTGRVTQETMVATRDKTARRSQSRIEGVYPNPTRSHVAIEYVLATDADVTIDIYDVLGRRMARLAEGHQAIGARRVTWSAEGTAAGVYVVCPDAGEAKSTHRLVIVR